MIIGWLKLDRIDGRYKYSDFIAIEKLEIFMLKVLDHSLLLGCLMLLLKKYGIMRHGFLMQYNFVYFVCVLELVVL